MTSGVYKIINNYDNKEYIGSSKEIERRWKDHVRSLRKGKHDNPYLQYAWNKYGEENFSFEVIIEVPEDCLLEEEDKFLTRDKTRSYNICEKAGKPPPRTESTYTRTPEMRKAQSERSKGHIKTKEQIQKQADSLRGQHFHSEEFKKAISARHKGIINSEETRKKMSETAKTRKRTPISEKARADRSENIRKKWQDPDYRSMMLAARKK
jgi:group I intron endonuclease